ncbi:MAG: fibronectin type III domain-containing protein [Armatimonadota bacterium]
MLLVAIGVAFQGGGNPTIQQGGTASFPRTGYDYPTGNNIFWDIVNPTGTIIATDVSPNGWNLNVVGDNLNVTCPSTATVANNYEVRFSGEYEASIGSVASAKARSSSINGNWGQPKSANSRKAGSKASTTDIIITPVSKSAFFNVISANAPPNAPTNLIATAAASNRINLAWQDNSINEGSFKVYRLAPGGNWNLITTTAANITSFSDLPLMPSTSYSYKVLAFNAYGESAYSNVATAQSFDLTPPPPGYAGNDFYFALPESGPTGEGVSANPHLRISSDNGATGLLTTIATGESIPFTVPAGGSTSVSLPESRRLVQNDSITQDAFRITTDNPINVMMLDEKPAASESWSVLPNTVLGTEYFSTNYSGTKDIHRSVIAFVATQNNTVVTITPKTICGTPPSIREANVPFTVTLQAGDTYQIKTFPAGDLTGSRIVSTKPIALYSGSVGAQVPLIYPSDNPLMEQLLPFDRWSTEFIGIPMATHAIATQSFHPKAYYRITAGRKYTNVQVYNGNTGVTDTYPMDKGDKLDLNTLDPIIVSADKPIQAVQLATGQDFDHVAGDPMMMPMPASISANNGRANWMSNTNIYVPTGEAMAGHYVTLISETHSMSTMYLNGNVINGWQGIGNTRYQYVSLSLAPGNNVINGIYQLGAWGQTVPARFIASAYGFNDYDAEGAAVGGAVYANGYVNVTPGDPSPLVATAVSAHEIDLSWTTSQDAYGYRIERKTDISGWVQLADVQSTSGTYPDTNLPHKAKFYYRVTAYADVDSNVSNTASATTLNEKPALPSGLGAQTLSSTEIKLTWSDNSDNEDSFKIERRLDGSSNWDEVKTTSPNATTWTDSGLTKKTKYYYHIKSVNEIGSLGWTSEVNATTTDTPPRKPLSLQASATSYHIIHLTWTDDSDNEDGFRVERQTGPDTWVPAGWANANAVSFDDYGVVGSTAYVYRAFAYNNGGDSDPSNTATATTPAPPIPATPSGLVANGISQSSIALHWTDNSDCENEFIIQRSTDGNSWFEVARTTANITTWNDNSLSASTTRWYKVAASNNTGPSGFCTPDDGTTFADSKIVGPHGEPQVCFTAAASASTINVYWTPSSGAQAYKVYRSTTKGAVGAFVGQISPLYGNQRIQKFIDSNLTTNTSYYYQVSSMNSEGESIRSNEDFEAPTSSAMPLNGTPAQMLSWAAGHVITGQDLPYIGMENTVVILPDGQIIDGEDGQLQDNSENISLEYEPQQQGNQNVHREDGGGQLTRVSQQSASVVSAVIDPTQVSYPAAYPNISNLIYTANAKTLLSYQSTNNATFSSMNGHVQKEGVNLYVAFTSFAQFPQYTNAEEFWPQMRGHSGVEIGFNLSHYGDGGNALPLRWVPFFRSSIHPENTTGYSNNPRVAIDFKPKTRYFRADTTFLGLGGVGASQLNLDGEIVTEGNGRWVVGEAQAVLGNVGQRVVGYYRNMKNKYGYGQLDQADNRAKIGLGLDQTFMSANMTANDWHPEPTPIYFKVGHFSTGSRGEFYLPSCVYLAEPNHNQANSWLDHKTNNCTYNPGGALPTVKITNN